jgi:hypothetical protein
MPDQTLTYDDAANVLLDRVFAPVFFNKLASAYGIAPANQAQAARLMQLAERERQLDDQEQHKAAGYRGDLIEQAHSYLDKALGTANRPADPTLKAAAADAAKDPLIRDAALLYQDALRQLAAQS